MAATTFRQVIDGAKFRADLSVNGAGPHLSERVTDPEWRILVNNAIKSAWRLAANARPDFQAAFQDFTIASGGSASFTVPANFYDVIDVVFAPDQPGEYSLGVFAFQNRRSPGGWFPANFGGSTNIGGNRARLMDSTVYIEPALRAGGTYRLWYCPAPKLIRADDTCRLATAAALPACTPSGSGLGKTLIANANGALTVDGTAAVAADIILVKNQPGATDNGIYQVTSAGSAGSPWALTRFDINVTQATGLGTMVGVTAGSANVDLFFETTSLTTVVDVSAWVWAEAFINPILEQHVELLEITTAIPAMVREDDLDPRALQLRAYGPDGTSGLVGELKAYFRQTRMNMGPSKVVDTDQRGPRSPWGVG